MAETIYQIYDKMFKKILTLSSKSVINLINGLFDTNYPVDSVITYNWTEFEDDELRKVLADTIITINGSHSYHMEAQMTVDEDIIFRVFDYGYQHARQNGQKEEGRYYLVFPEPKIIYLYVEKQIPEQYTLVLDFGMQGSFEYKVSALNYQKITMEELNQKKMVILIPFSLLRLRDTLRKERTPEKLFQLKCLIQDDIIENINKNVKVGNITPDDARKLRRLTHKLYDHLYAHYSEMEELNDMTDESLMLDIDIIEKEHEKALAEKDKVIAEVEKMNRELQQRLNLLINNASDHHSKMEDLNDVTDESLMLDIDIIEKEHEKALAEKDKIIAELKKQVLELEKQIGATANA